MKKLSALLLCFAMLFVLCACSQSLEGPSATCENGVFVGSETESGILSFKGIPYAKAPVGELRWKAPEPVEDSDETYSAKEYGTSAIQYFWHSEAIETEVGEDCLTLNVWTSGTDTADKAVMVYFHGGAFAWGGSSEPIYNAQYIVEEHPDVVVVTCNYRVGIMGFIDFSGIEGGESFPDSSQLGLLDALESLRWIQNNIEAFGGDPDNVTIFGESAGGTLVSLLLSTEYAGTLFHRVIAESGSVNLSSPADVLAESAQAEILMELTGCTNMDELMALSEKELIKANETALDEDETTLNDIYSLPLAGGVVPEDPIEAVRNGSGGSVDLLIGTNREETNYWVNEMSPEGLDKLDEEGIATCIALFDEYFISSNYDTILEGCSDEEAAQLEDFLALYADQDVLWQKSRLFDEYLFRRSSIELAEVHSESAGTGKTYMYLFGKSCEDYDFYGACHASELPYVFHNLNDLGETMYHGNINEQLADDICTMWTNFAKTGDPSLDSVEWTEYDGTERNTMIIGEDGSLTMESDPLPEQRILTQFLKNHRTNMIGA